MYLFAVNEEGLHVAPERTPAYTAGEVWFEGDDRVVLNLHSGRFGERRAEYKDGEDGAARLQEVYAEAVKAWSQRGYDVDIRR